MKKFNFNTDKINIEKAETEDYVEISGLASTPDIDLQGESLIQEGLDISYLNAAKGYLIADHGSKYQNKDHARMGIIDEAKFTPEGLWIQGKIWKKHPESISYINELKHGKSGTVQLSVEGSVVERDLLNPKKVTKAKILGVALTRNPVNTKTYAQLIKSFQGEAEESFFHEIDNQIIYTAEQVSALLKALGISQNYGTTPSANLTGGSALQKENLDGSPKNVTSTFMKPKTDEEKEETKIASEEKKKREKEAKAGISKPKKLVKSMTLEEYESKISESLDKLQAQFPDKTRNELWDSLKNQLENNFFEEN